MMKRYEDSLLRVVEGLLKDASTMFPKHRREFKRDLTRIRSLVKHRGISVLTLDFPAHLKHVDMCLSEGLYAPSKLPATKGRKKDSVIPGLFQGILIQIFDDDGMLRERPNTDAIALLRQLLAFAKKVKIDCKKERVYETLKTFFQVDEELPDPSLDWWSSELKRRGDCHIGVESYRCSSSHADWSYLDHPVDYQLRLWCQNTFDIISSTLGVFNAEEWEPKHGPGAVSDLRFGEYKYHFPNWTEELDAVFPVSSFAYANEGIWVDNIERIEFVPSTKMVSKLICVPKTQKGPRLIAAEPTAHQWCQQALLRFFDTRAKTTWLKGFVRFNDQTFNQDGARRASLSGDYWTVDLSAASDRLSLRVVESLFRNNYSVLEALHASRTRYVRQDLDKTLPNILKIKKFSMMGSACTFPIETFVFLGIALSCVLYARGLKPSLRNIESLWGEVRVFGDDIIIPEDAGEQLVSLLGYLDFEVNEAKTHRNGRFRESCGLEAYDGVDVTPAYVLRVPQVTKPESIVSCVESSNNFHLKGWWHAADAIRSTVTGVPVMPVFVNSGSFGWKSFCKGTPSDVKTRWSKTLHRMEVKVSRFSTVARRRPIQSEAVLLQYFTEDPEPMLPWVSGAASPPKSTLRLGWEDASEVYDL